MRAQSLKFKVTLFVTLGLSAAMVVPKIAGQDRDYLVMALRAYRDDRRASTTMHKMSLPYGDAVIESIASYYASQPAR